MTSSIKQMMGYWTATLSDQKLADSKATQKIFLFVSLGSLVVLSILISNNLS